MELHDPTADNLCQYLLAPAARTPDKAAVVEPDETGTLTEVSYRQLSALVEEYTRALEPLGLDVGDRVVVEAHSCAAAVALLLACAKLGLPFVPVSPQTPDNRLLAILKSVEPALHVRADGLDRRDLPWAGGTARFGRSGLTTEQPPARRTRRRRRVLAVDTAYIIFTSGSTGRPKGVVMSHRAIVTFLRAVIADGLVSDTDRVASTSPLPFDFALFGIGIALGSGATLVPVGREYLDSPRRMVNFLRDADVTQVHGVPSLWRPVLRHDPELLKRLDKVRSVVFAGEGFPLAELRRLQEMLAGTRLVNGYGATESMAASFTDVPDPLPARQQTLSIGRAHRGAEMTLVDTAGRVVTQPGVVAEIHLRSPALFSGYWDDPGATAQVLVPDPLDPRHGQAVLRTGDLAYLDEKDELYFVGRADSQVQIRGHRVELGEVEGVLARLPAVTSAAATLVPRGGDHVLMAGIVLDDTTAPFDEDAALAFCAQELSAYMTPRRIRPLADLPLTENGKVDRVLLARLVTTAVPYGPTDIDPTLRSPV
ncbi:AMP-binding protein [Streptomyces sp. NBC_01283]|uniref:AMP-binding protein n=1 Tax=Streptomyces sp. NBC_01283 TaxID=2903812 RepID=UPI00352F702E|nr:AMP-binding protein [Streptomyces sp. NBC_01283]WSL21394.1 AMP-binding protein [Streptomyces sp. NBC_01283]